jgi:hypothetical protein
MKIESKIKEFFNRTAKLEKVSWDENVYLDFGGFYESIHSGLIECEVERQFEDDEGNFDQVGFDNYNWREAFEKYAEHYVDMISDYLCDVMDVPFTMKYVSLVSPRFYNFSTDKIEVHIGVEDATRLSKWMASENEAYLDQVITDVTTSRDGYVPFRTYDEVCDDPQLLTEICLSITCDMYNQDELIDGINSMVPLEFLY